MSKLGLAGVVRLCAAKAGGQIGGRRKKECGRGGQRLAYSEFQCFLDAGSQTSQGTSRDRNIDKSKQHHVGKSQ
jgi:hypothetical protein